MSDLEEEISRLNDDLEGKNNTIDKLRQEIKTTKIHTEDYDERISEMEELCSQYRSKIKELKNKQMKKHFGDRRTDVRIEDVIAVNKELEDQMQSLMDRLKDVEYSMEVSVKKQVNKGVEKLMKKSNEARAKL